MMCSSYLDQVVENRVFVVAWQGRKDLMFVKGRNCLGGGEGEGTSELAVETTLVAPHSEHNTLAAVMLEFVLSSSILLTWTLL